MLDKEERTVALVENCPAGEAKGGLACGILLTVAVLSRPIGTLDQKELVSEGQQSYLTGIRPAGAATPSPDTPCRPVQKPKFSRVATQQTPGTLDGLGSFLWQARLNLAMSRPSRRFPTVMAR